MMEFWMWNIYLELGVLCVLLLVRTTTMSRTVAGAHGNCRPDDAGHHGDPQSYIRLSYSHYIISLLCKLRYFSCPSRRRRYYHHYRRFILLPPLLPVLLRFWLAARAAVTHWGIEGGALCVCCRSLCPKNRREWEKEKNGKRGRAEGQVAHIHRQWTSRERKIVLLYLCICTGSKVFKLRIEEGYENSSSDPLQLERRRNYLEQTAKQLGNKNIFICNFFLLELFLVAVEAELDRILEEG